MKLLNLVLVLLTISLVQAYPADESDNLLVESTQQTSDAKGTFIAKIDSALNAMADVLIDISSSVEGKAPQICNKSIENLGNSQTDWNPKATYVHNDKVSVVCNEGFRTKTNLTTQSVKCLLGNTWSIFHPCLETCSHSIKSVLYTEPQIEEDEIYTVGDKVTIKCSEGMRTDANTFTQLSTCHSGDKWSSFQPCTQPTCTKELENIENADTDWSKDVIYSPGDKIIITCKENYRTKDRTAKQTSTCFLDSFWTSFEPCQEICPAPFVKRGDICIYEGTDPKTWRDARTGCSKMKEEYVSSLAMFQTETKQRDFISYLNVTTLDSRQPHWMAGHDMFEENWFVWNDASEITSLYEEFKWEDGQPDNFDGDEHCLAYHPNGLQDASCDSKKPYFCLIRM